MAIKLREWVSAVPYLRIVLPTFPHEFGEGRWTATGKSWALWSKKITMKMQYK